MLLAVGKAVVLMRRLVLLPCASLSQPEQQNLAQTKHPLREYSGKQVVPSSCSCSLSPADGLCTVFHCLSDCRPFPDDVLMSFATKTGVPLNYSIFSILWLIVFYVYFLKVLPVHVLFHSPLFFCF